MTVWFVGAGPGDPELLTRKAEKLLAVCRICIWAGSLVHPAILDFLPGECIRYDSAEMSLDQIINVIREAHDKNIDVVRLHTGEPSIFGAIGEQMARLDTLGIDYETVPGISSFQAAAAALKTELTMPEVSQTVILTRTGGRTPMPEKESLANITAAGGTVCVFLSVDKTEETAQAFAGALGRDCPAAVVYHASWPDQKIIRGTLDTIGAQVRAAGLKRTGIIIIGRALGEKNTESRLYSPEFTHGYRTGQKHT